ncbi:E3 ubiquitin-protein ligase ATL4 [Mercurialis annua]|uniref:E3 ubiquitin-protein ligase ATL4 n=1 Tax=Mercurialis annua TaxID=3986 RepID=UPI00215F546F|nr:E3 ubiquitin-protein ligase ATL4 [Mercurialis annua]
MSFFVEDSCLVVTHLIYQTAVILAIVRWALSWALRSRNSAHSSSPSSTDSLRQSHHLPSSQQIRDGLILTTFGDINGRISGASDTCAVCLGKLNEHDQVRELRNCCHVFHRECIDRWVDHDQDHDHDDNHKTCPLCRAPLLTTTQSMVWAKSEPSWAVENILYLFGDDLFIQH